MSSRAKSVTEKATFPSHDEETDHDLPSQSAIRLVSGQEVESTELPATDELAYSTNTHRDSGVVNDPLVILADEPTGNFDPETRNHVLSFFDDFHRAGKTIIVVTSTRKQRVRQHARYI